MCKIISVANQKGGVGKTTTAFNISAALALKNSRVLAIDFEPQADLSKYADFDNTDGNPTMSDLLIGKVGMSKTVKIKDCIRHSEINNLDYIPCDINLANADLFLAGVLSRETILKRILNDDIIKQYDYVIIDCNPSLGVLLMNALTASSGVIIPVQVQDFAFGGLKTLTGVIAQIQETINPDLKSSAYCRQWLTVPTQASVLLNNLKASITKLFLALTYIVLHRQLKALNNTKLYA